MPRRINSAGLKIIAAFEGGTLRAYQDVAGIWVIGYGHIRGVEPGMTVTEEQALAFLHEDLGDAEAEVAAATSSVATDDNQFAAMVSLCFNIGSGNFRNSSVLRLHRAGQPAAAADAFLLWDKAHVNGELQEVAGLRTRRARERELYLASEEETWGIKDTRRDDERPRPPPPPPIIEAKRFTDVAIYAGHLYPGVDLATERKLADDEPLFSGQEYTLEIAIRQKRTGIDADIESPRAVRNPRQDKQELNIYVFATALDSIVEIEESFTTIHWRYDTDSESAFFRFNVPPLGQGAAMSQGAIEVRLYDRCLDLLDIVEISITAVSSARLNYTTLGIERRHLLWPDTPPATPRIGVHCLSRFLSIHVLPASVASSLSSSSCAATVKRSPFQFIEMLPGMIFRHSLRRSVTFGLNW
jgi:lysozyme